MFRYFHRRTLNRLLLAPAITAALVGCRGQAQRDLYQAKMAHEIRVLEDQLYEADYHNRVLIDKLEQVRLKSEPAVKSRAPGVGSYEAIPTPVPRPLRTPEADLGEGDSKIPDELGEIGTIVDEGQPADAEEITVPPTLDPFLDDPKQLDGPGQKEVEQGDRELGMEAEDASKLLPAPGGPEPPSKQDTDIPPVLPGEILPPSILDEQQDKPPGQILLPDSAQDGVGVPDQLRLHPSLSGGHRIDGKVENMVIVVNVLDERGRPLSLSDFDVEADLSVVIFEADQDETEEARIGRWDFSADQVKELVKSEPISGLHIPIQWQGDHPQGDEIIVHIRLRAEEDEMRCEGRLKVERANAVAEWTPRADLLK